MEKTVTESILSDVATYYTDKLEQHGETAKGVDWNGEQSQQLRFQHLCKIISDHSTPYSLNDLGCGYGALFDFLVKHSKISSYLGMDISEKMIASAKNLYSDERARARFLLANKPDRDADYGVASGIFNVRLDETDENWLNYITSTLDMLDQTSEKGFAFNCLTSYSDQEKKRDYLYYADPCALFDWCKKHYSKQVSLLHDYGLYEFTILVRK